MIYARNCNNNMGLITASSLADEQLDCVSGGGARLTNVVTCAVASGAGGAVAGGLLGSVVPGLGTVVGAVLGGVEGALVGAVVGAIG